MGVDDELDGTSHHQSDSRVTVRQALRPVTDLRSVFGVLAAFGFAYYFALTRLVRGDLLNSYPFISNDGFDWLLEGFAVARWFDGVAIPELPAARNPGFVSVIFGDFQIGADGGLLFAVISVAVVTSMGVMLLLAWWEQIPRYQAAVVVLVFAVSPLGFYRMWILSDQIATALLVVAVVALYPYITGGSRRWLIGATVAAALGGATQIYALMAFLVVGGWCFAVSAWRRKPDHVLAAALVLAPVTTLLLGKLWLGQVPHTGVPAQLSLIRFNFDMLGFYANAWPFAFAPLLPLLVVLVAYRRREVLESSLLTGYWLAVLALMGSTFFYQVEDFRFTIPTSLMLGVAIMATLPGERPLPRPRELMATTLIFAVFVGIFLAPVSYWRPRWSEMEVNLSNTYFARLLTVEPRDRFSLAEHCQSSRFCDHVPLPVRASEYRRARFGIYRYLVNADSSTALVAYYDEIYEGVFDQRNTNDCCLADASFSYGLRQGRPVAGDWDGLPAADTPNPKVGADTPGVFDAGVWLLRNSNSAGPADLEFGFGQAGDVPIVGDWNGDGIDTIGVFRNGVWLLRNSNSAGPADLEFGFGQAGDVPIVGDWNGDGMDTVGVFRKGQWLLRNSTDDGPSDIRFDFGAERDRPVSGDWDGDGVDTIGTFTQGLWKLRNTNADGTADLDFYFGAFADLPITGDWNNNGVDTIGISR